MSRSRFRIAAITTTAALLVPMIPLVTQGNAWATASRSNSPDGKKVRSNAPGKIHLPKATLPTSVTGLSPGSPVWIARWDGTTSHISIRIKPNLEVSIFDITRDKNKQPPGSAGHMIASALRETPNPKPPALQVDMINHPSTVKALAEGVHPGETVIGRMIGNAVLELGGTITKWESRDKLPVDAVKAYIAYP